MGLSVGSSYNPYAVTTPFTASDGTPASPSSFVAAPSALLAATCIAHVARVSLASTPASSGQGVTGDGLASAGRSALIAR